MSDDFITITTFNFPQDSYVARAFLGSEGIESRVKDENLAQVYNFISQAIGGAKLQVRKADYERAVKLLVEGGYMAEPKPLPRPRWMQWLDQFGSKYEFFRHSSQKSKILLFGLILFLVLGTFLGVVAYFNYRIPDDQFLIENTWILEGIEYGGKSIAPRTVTNTSGSDSEIQVLWVPAMNETISFRRNGSLWIPGFQTPASQGEWFLNGDSIYFSKLSRNKEVFEGSFYLDRSRRRIELISNKTVIHARKW